MCLQGPSTGVFGPAARLSNKQATQQQSRQQQAAPVASQHAPGEYSQRYLAYPVNCVALEPSAVCQFWVGNRSSASTVGGQ